MPGYSLGRRGGKWIISVQKSTHYGKYTLMPVQSLVHRPTVFSLPWFSPQGPWKLLMGSTVQHSLWLCINTMVGPALQLPTLRMTFKANRLLRWDLTQRCTIILADALGRLNPLRIRLKRATKDTENQFSITQWKEREKNLNTPRLALDPDIGLKLVDSPRPQADWQMDSSEYRHWQ